MEKKFKVSYDKVEDIFSISARKKSKFSIDLALHSGDVIVDIGYDGLVVGLEIFNASQFFSVAAKELASIKDAHFKVVYSPSYVAVSVELQKKDEIVKSNLIIPYNKKLILSA